MHQALDDTDVDEQAVRGHTEITWEKGVDPTAVGRLGEPVQVVVVGADRDRQRISLSIKRLGADPGSGMSNELDTGQTIDATLARVMPYGAFAPVVEGVEGLIHVSEFGREQVVDSNVAVSIGDVLPVRIVAVDRERRRPSLSARLADAHETLSASRTPRVANV